MLVALTETINSNLDLRQVLQAVTDTGTKISGAAFGVCFYDGLEGSGEPGRGVVVSGGDAEAFAAMAAMAEMAEMAEMAAAGLTGLPEPGVVGTASVRVDDLSTEPRPDGMPLGHLGVRSYLGTPVVSRTGEVIGSLVFGHPDPGVFTPESVRAVRAVAAQAAIAVENARLFAAEQAARLRAEQVVARLALLQQITARLATAMTTGDVLREVVDALTSPPLAVDRAGVYLRERDEFRAVGGLGLEPIADEPSSATLPTALRSPVRDAAERGRPVLLRTEGEFHERYPELSAGGLGGIRTGLSLPLILPGSVPGVLAMAWHETKALDEDDVDMLAAVAGQLASAMERARLYEALTEVSRTLQRSLLPRSLPDVPQVAVAVRYLPGAEDAEVGGDWYDVVPTPTGEVSFVVGDVEGHSISAASVMGQLRAALHAYLAEGHPAEVALARANRVLEEVDPTVIATCAIATLDPGTGMLSIVRAGHPNPLVRQAAGAVKEVDAAGGVPLGVLVETTWPVTTLQLEAGDRLVLYTDGLVERPGQSLDVGIGQLATAVAAGDGGAESGADGILAAMGGHLNDDVALLVCDFAGPVEEHLSAALVLDPDVRAVAAAREFARVTLTGWGLAETVQSAELVVSELVTNAVVHTRGTATLELRWEDSRLRLSVTDEHTGIPPTRHEIDVDATSGRGLLLVDGLVVAWGVAPHGEGKTIWAELEVS